MGPFRVRRPNAGPRRGGAAWLDETRRFLVLQGYEVVTAAGGVDCLAALRPTSRAVLVLDRDLPWGGADGVLAVMQDDLGRVPVLPTVVRPCDDRRAAAAPALGTPLDRDALLDGIRAAVGYPLPGRRNPPKGNTVIESDRTAARPDVPERDNTPETEARERWLHGGVTLQEATRVRAYHLWEAAGRPAGDGVSFWLEAEADLVAADRRNHQPSG